MEFDFLFNLRWETIPIVKNQGGDKRLGGLFFFFFLIIVKNDYVECKGFE